MQAPNELYHEEIRFTVVWWALFAFGLSAAGFLYLAATNPIGNNSPPGGYYLATGVFMVMVSFVVFQFRKIFISITLDAVNVSFGLFSYRIPYRHIFNTFVDEKPGIVYSGWGLRLARVRGKSALVYSVLNTPRVVIEQNCSRYGFFIFSTRNPEEVIGLIRKQAGLK
jgi:hypothetical protein